MSLDEALYVRVSFCGLPYSRRVRETPAHSVVPRHLPRFLPEGMAPAVTGWSMLRATVVLCQSAVGPERDFIHPDIQLFEPRSLKQTLLPHLKGWAPLPAGHWRGSASGATLSQSLQLHSHSGTRKRMPSHFIL